MALWGDRVRVFCEGVRKWMRYREIKEMKRADLNVNIVEVWRSAAMAVRLVRWSLMVV